MPRPKKPFFDNVPPLKTPSSVLGGPNIPTGGQVSGKRAQKRIDTPSGSTDESLQEMLINQNKNTKTTVKATYAELETKVKQLHLQYELLRKDFNFNKVKEELTIDDESFVAMLTDENRKLNQRLQDLESGAAHKAKMDAITTENEKLKKRLHDELSKISKFEETEKQLQEQLAATNAEMAHLEAKIEETNDMVLCLVKKLNDADREISELKKMMK